MRLPAAVSVSNIESIIHFFYRENKTFLYLLWMTTTVTASGWCWCWSFILIDPFVDVALVLSFERLFSLCSFKGPIKYSIRVYKGFVTESWPKSLHHQPRLQTLSQLALRYYMTSSTTAEKGKESVSKREIFLFRACVWCPSTIVVYFLLHAITLLCDGFSLCTTTLQFRYDVLIPSFVCSNHAYSSTWWVFFWFCSYFYCCI